MHLGLWEAMQVFRRVVLGRDDRLLAKGGACGAWHRDGGGEGGGRGRRTRTWLGASSKERPGPGPTLAVWGLLTTGSSPTETARTTAQ